MNEQHGPDENSEERPFSRLADDLRPRLISGPTDYERRADGPVQFVEVANAEGVLGLLYASDAEGAVGFVVRKEMGYHATKSVQFWKGLWRSAFRRGLAPTEALAEMAQQEGGHPVPGRVLSGPWQEAPDLAALREEIVGDSRWVPSPSRLKVKVHPVIALHGPKFRAPEVTWGMRRAARRHPGKGLFAVDPAYDPHDDDIPWHKSLGGWPIDEHGELGDFRFNPRYEPTLTALRWRAPENEVERAMQGVWSRTSTAEAFLDALREATLLVPVDSDGKQLLFGRTHDGRRVLDVYTSAHYASHDDRRLRAMTGAELAKGLFGCSIAVNAGSRPNMRIPASDLAVSAFG
ncbi:type VII secretion system-associated protein [Streptomyces sp. NPDC057253]|uniref:type VII secretion system-associated protein n=1 Tax=Streptomyces sp. NPDC057253 TaxID=3346069 RepID=UPI00363EFD57